MGPSPHIKRQRETVGNSCMAQNSLGHPVPTNGQLGQMRLFLAMVVMVMAVSGVQNVSAADSPAPSPTSDASAFLPTFFASLAALAFGLLF
ncbi:hypothetical protein JRO89_XS04G0122100 [Xanthoceras sorbifolium]|uniref:Uncharacterized protein n=1 Tax=Xanthoceras sorbifolium TaxID=99658 RepID=A0ABQ8I568_9ROSI|nr:hypothetical protein JRO89_XS04G0122100 [Xanthoceras sorbifolium]